MPTITIRRAELSDAPTISLLARITFDQTFGGEFRDRQDLLDYFEQTFSVAKITSSLQQSNNVFWIAYVDDLPVGYAKLKLASPSPFVKATSIVQLQKIYVLRDFQALKVGHHLQSELLSYAQKVGSDVIWLSVLDRNEKAQRFYLRHGFLRVGQHAFSIGKEDFDFFVFSRPFSVK